MRFGFPMIWREPKNHHDDCYFCCVNVMGIESKNRKNLQYPQVESVSRPVPHSDDIPIPIFQSQTSSSQSDSCSSMSMRANSDPEYFQQIEPQFFNQQAELNDLVRDLNLSKENSELLTSRLKERNLVGSDVNITFYRNRHEEFLPFFEKR